MNIRTTLKNLPRTAAVILVAISLASCSSMGRAVVTEVDGMPCFAIPKSWATRNGLPLHGLTVVQRNAPDADPYSKYVWIFNVEPPGHSILTRPENCMRYGATPKLATQTQSKPLEPYQVYSVFIHAKPDNSPMRGYSAEFCIKPADAGKPRLLVVPFDEKAGQWRYDLCDRPG